MQWESGNYAARREYGSMVPLARRPPSRASSFVEAGMPHATWRFATFWFTLSVPIFQLSQIVFEEGWFHANFLTALAVKK